MVEFICKDTLDEYEAFLQGHRVCTFAQSVLWARQKPDWAWEAMVVRGTDGKIKGALAVLYRKVPGLRYTLMYGCRGPVCDLDDESTLLELISAAKRLARDRRSYVLKLDPAVASSNARFTDFLLGQGFSEPKQNKNFEAIQPRYVFRLDLTGHDRASLMAGFQSKTRYNIRLAERYGVQVRVCGERELPEFSALMLETGLRDGFVTRSPEYFSRLLKNLGGHARLYMAYYQGRPVAGSIAVTYGDKTWYIYGASSGRDRHVMPNYLLQWNMIQWALDSGCRIYDFRGVSGDVSEENPLYGLYRFKKGFGGELIEFVGELNYIVNPGVFRLIHTGYAMLRSVRRGRYLFRGRSGGK